MTLRKSPGRLAGMAVMALAGAGRAAAEPPPDYLCAPATHPSDAVRVAPDQHRVLLENERVRVLEIRLPPGAIEPPHIHALPSVIQGDTGGGTGARFLYIEYRAEDGRFVEAARREVTPAPGFRTVWAEPEGPHAIVNTGPVAVSFIRTEIKPAACRVQGRG
jgi:hypothetical protein